MTQIKQGKCRTKRSNTNEIKYKTKCTKQAGTKTRVNTKQSGTSTKMNTKQNGKNTMINTKQMIQKQGKYKTKRNKHICEYKTVQTESKYETKRNNYKGKYKTYCTKQVNTKQTVQTQM